MLHLISQTKFTNEVLERIGPEDVVTLLDGAVLRALGKGEMASALTELLQRARCCVLREHLALFGIAEHEIVSGIEVIDFSGLVNLTLDNTLIHTWR